MISASAINRTKTNLSCWREILYLGLGWVVLIIFKNAKINLVILVLMIKHIKNKMKSRTVGNGFTNKFWIIRTLLKLYIDTSSKRSVATHMYGYFLEADELKKDNAIAIDEPTRASNTSCLKNTIMKYIAIKKNIFANKTWPKYKATWKDQLDIK